MFTLRRLLLKRANPITTESNPEAILWLAEHGHAQLAGAELGTRFRCQEPWQAAVLEQQLAFRKRTRRRFPNPEKWLWTDRSLAQASDWWSATYKASLFPDGASVVDGCSGAGVDALALAERGPVLAMELDPSLVALASANLLAAQGQQREYASKVICGRVPEDIPSDTEWLHVDPDRRPTHRKTREADEFSPPLGQLMQTCSKMQGACIKIAPSTLFDPDLEQELDAADVHRVWLGSFAECRQQLLLFGQAQVAAEYPQSAVLCHPTPCVFSGDWETEVDVTDAPGSYVYDLHAALHASELQLAWADQHAMHALGGEHGFFTSQDLVDSPWAQAFEVLEVLAWDDRKLRKWLRRNQVRQVEVKSRNFRLDASQFQRRYTSPTGERDVSVLVTQLGSRVKAIVCQRR